VHYCALKYVFASLHEHCEYNSYKNYNSSRIFPEALLIFKNPNKTRHVYKFYPETDHIRVKINHY